MESAVTPPSKCPRCGYKFDRASGAFGDYAPRERDLTACMMCGLLMVFNADLTVHIATDQEIQSLGPEERRQVFLLMRSIRKMKAKRN